MINYLMEQRPEALAEVVGVRRECFQHSENIGKEIDPALLEDKLDHDGSARSYILRNSESEVVGTIRVSIFAPWLGRSVLPASAFCAERLERDYSERGAVQGSMWGVRREFRKQSAEASLALVRTTIAIGLKFGVPDFVGIVDNKETKLGIWRRLNVTPQGEPFTHPFTSKGAVFIAGKISEMMEAAASDRRLRALIDFAEEERMEGLYPVRV